jgi:Ca2+-binding EF-hand superfamily protein
MNNNVKILIAFLASLTLMMGCGQKAEVQESSTNGSSEQNTEVQEQVTSESSEEGTEENMSKIELIPIDVWTLIDVNKAGQVTETEFVDYYVAKAGEGEKLSAEDAQKKFQTLDQNQDGQLTKPEATGEQ